MDLIRIRELEVFYRVGVPDEERAKPQRLLLNIELAHDFTKAAATDDLRHTIDYYELSRLLLAFGHDREWRLIEKLASDVADLILADFKPARVRVEVQKFILPETKFVSVEVERP